MHKISFDIQPIEKILSVSGLTKKGSLVEQVYQDLRRNIINLKLPPEMPLIEKEIAAIYGVSKTPVREALIRLTNDRLVSVVPKSGSYITPINLERYFEACFIRVSLECGCVRRLSEKGIGMADQVKLKSIIARQRQILERQAGQSGEDQTTDYAPFFEVDQLFHRTLFECAGLQGAWKVLDSARAELDRVRHLKRLMGINRSSAVLEEHSKILEAIINRDARAAEQTLEYHIGGVDDEIDVISENPQFLQSIEEFNLLVNVQRRGRNKRKLSFTTEP